MSGDERRGWTGEKDDCSRYVHGFTDTMQRGDAFDDIIPEGRVGEGRPSSRSVNERRRYSIRCDVVTAPLHRQTFREMCDAGLGHAVNGFIRQSGETGLQTDIYDAPDLLTDHHSHRSLATEECSFQVHR